VIALEHLTHGVDVVFSKLRIGLTDDHDLDTWILKAQESCLDSYGPRFSASTS
jgi:hypothetical protein